MVGSNVGLQMDRVYCSKDEEEEETEDLNAHKEVWKTVFELYVSPSHGDLGYVSYHLTSESSYLTDLPVQTKTPDHRPPMFRAEFDASETSTRAPPLSHNLSPTVWSKVSGRLFWTSYIRR